MRRRTSRRCLALALSLCASTASAQPVEPLAIPTEARAGDAPETPGTGASAMAVQGFFHGFPSSLADARDLLEGRSVAPAFEAWCGEVPYVDFTNGTVLDSFGRKAPTALCLPYFDPARQVAPHSCEPLRGLPQGDYYQGGGLVMRIEGSLAIREAGVYTLAWGHDDGVAFRFGETVVYEFNDPTGSRVDRRAVTLPAPGRYPFTLEWYDTIGGALIDWYIARGDASQGGFDGRFALVSRSDLYPSNTAPCTARCERCEGATPVCDRSARRCVACAVDAHCPPCEACRAHRCVPVGDAPGADAGSACAPDAGAVIPDAAIDDAPMGDGARALTPGPGATGCACGAGALRPWGAGATLTLVAIVMAARRRRPR